MKLLRPLLFLSLLCSATLPAQQHKSPQPCTICFDRAAALLQPEKVKTLVIQGDDTLGIAKLLPLFVSLEELVLDGNYNTLPAEIGSLSTLKSLEIMGKTAHLPAELKNLAHLREFRIRQGQVLVDDPSRYAENWPELRVLEADMLAATTPLEELAALAKLEVLIIDGSGRSSLPAGIEKLDHLHAFYFSPGPDFAISAGAKLPSALKNLALETKSSKGLYAFLEQTNLDSIRSLSLVYTGTLPLPNAPALTMQQLPHLDSLSLTHFDHLEMLHVDQFDKLKYLELRECGEALPAGIAGAVSLRSFDFSGQHFDAAAVSNVPKLREIHIDAYTYGHLEQLKNITTLRTLNFSNTTPPAAEIGQLKQLRLLYLPGSTPDDERKRFKQLLPGVKIKYHIFIPVTY